MSSPSWKLSPGMFIAWFLEMNVVAGGVGAQ
jgi:hypothetical protein